MSEIAQKGGTMRRPNEGTEVDGSIRAEDARRRTCQYKRCSKSLRVVWVLSRAMEAVILPSHKPSQVEHVLMYVTTRSLQVEQGVLLLYNFKLLVSNEPPQMLRFCPRLLSSIIKYPFATRGVSSKLYLVQHTVQNSVIPSSGVLRNRMCPGGKASRQSHTVSLQ